MVLGVTYEYPRRPGKAAEDVTFGSPHGTPDLPVEQPRKGDVFLQPRVPEDHILRVQVEVPFPLPEGHVPFGRPTDSVGRDECAVEVFPSTPVVGIRPNMDEQAVLLVPGRTWTHLEYVRPQAVVQHQVVRLRTLELDHSQLWFNERRAVIDRVSVGQVPRSVFGTGLVPEMSSIVFLNDRRITTNRQAFPGLLGNEQLLAVETWAVDDQLDTPRHRHEPAVDKHLFRGAGVKRFRGGHALCQKDEQ